MDIVKTDRSNYEIERLNKLRLLVISEKKKAEHNEEPDDMTIMDLEEWLAEIDAELVTIQKQ